MAVERVDDADRWVLRLWPDVGHVREARRFVRDVVAPWGAGSLDEVAVMTSEVVTNAMVHARSHVTVRVRHAGAFGRVEVHDDSTEIPKPQPLDFNRSGGNGLIILDALATKWGVNSTADRGKVVWFEFPIACRDS